MGCDGIWESKSSQQMVEWIRRKLNEENQLGKVL